MTSPLPLRTLRWHSLANHPRCWLTPGGWANLAVMIRGVRCRRDDQVQPLAVPGMQARREAVSTGMRQECDSSLEIRQRETRCMLEESVQVDL